MCRAEFRLLNEQYPAYADRLNLVAIGIDPREGPEVLRAYQTAGNYPWTFAVGNRPMLEAYRVISTSIKYGLDRDGVIIFHKGYGTGTPDEWTGYLRSLAGA